MKQIIQQYKNGKLQLVEVPYPACPPDGLLIKNRNSVISIGTERGVIELGRKSLAGKARSRPDLVKRFVEKARNEGLGKTYQSAMRRLNEAKPLGYSCSGTVVEVGSRVGGFTPGEKVACVGAGFACHAEYVTVPESLCAKIPEAVSMEEAAYGMLGIIAMHAMRSARLTQGEHVAVIGLGLLGLILVQLLTAYGFQVIATDLDEQKCKLSRESGVENTILAGDDFIQACEHLTGGIGVDAVILAVATNSDKPVHDAVKISRFGGRIVLMGVADVHPHRNEMWEKEVEIIVSKAGGPRAEDPLFGLKGLDYPPGYIRWTEMRNLQEFLRLISVKKVRTDILTTHRNAFTDILSVYEKLLSKKEQALTIGVLIQYIEDSPRDRTFALKQTAVQEKAKDFRLHLGVIGGGLFATTTILPILSKQQGIHLAFQCTSRGHTAYHVGRENGFTKCTTDYKEVIADGQVNAVVIMTRHDLHAAIVCEALEQGKHVFVEKPLCINHDELDTIIDLYNGLTTKPILFVGYNRRFSPLAIKLREFYGNRHNPIVAHYRVNAGYLSPDHWAHDESNGKGRIVGEVCHMVDFLIYLTKSYPVKISVERASCERPDFVSNDNVVINLKFKDGSIGNVTYSSLGDRALPRERMEVYCDGKVAVLNDFRNLKLYAQGKRKKIKFSSQSMGYQEEIQNFLATVKGNENPGLTPEEIFYSTRAVFCAHDAIEKGTSQTIVL